MRFIIYGAGAVGAVMGARLHGAGYDVVLIARGPHADAMRARGLVLETPSGRELMQIPTVTSPDELDLTTDDAVILAMKTQDVSFAIDHLAAVAPLELTMVCAQNGVEAERIALRRFERVQGLSVMLPALFLRPGHVQAYGHP